MHELFSEVDQIGLVVRQLEPAMERYVAAGIGPWWVGTYAPPRLTDMKLRGKDVRFSMRVALAFVGRTQWELIQPLEGPSIYWEHLEERGESIHHVQLAVRRHSLDELTRSLAALNCPVVMEGRFGGSRFVYFDTTALLGVMAEVRDAPADYVRPEPDFWYPEGAETAAFRR